MFKFFITKKFKCTFAIIQKKVLRYFAEIRYHGAAYCGWQVQDNAHTVQAAVNKALFTLLGPGSDCLGCGRTDTGVHATQFYFHFNTSQVIDAFRFIYQFNSIVGVDIAMLGLYPVRDDCHARFDATSRCYHYVITRYKDPFLNQLALFQYDELNLALMNEACQNLKQHTDFTSLSKTKTQVKTNICNIQHAQWEVAGDYTFFKIESDRFLRGMVRALVGTMLLIGREKMKLSQFENILLGRNRKLAGENAEPYALYLSGVKYSFINNKYIRLPSMLGNQT